MKKIMLLLMLFTLMCAGCMRDGVPHPDGISLGIGRWEDSNWYDTDKKKCSEDNYGVKFDLAWGWAIRPIPDPFCDDEEENCNPWKGGKYLTILKFPVIAPYISVAAGKYGFYLGFKAFEVYEPRHTGLDRYGHWLVKYDVDYGTEDKPAVYLQPSARMTANRCD